MPNNAKFRESFFWSKCHDDLVLMPPHRRSYRYVRSSNCYIAVELYWSRLTPKITIHDPWWIELDLENSWIEGTVIISAIHPALWDLPPCTHSVHRYSSRQDCCVKLGVPCLSKRLQYSQQVYQKMFKKLSTLQHGQYLRWLRLTAQLAMTSCVWRLQAQFNSHSLCC